MQMEIAAGREILPAGRCRLEVRGLSPSKRRSTIRLNAMAQVRAPVMAVRMRRKAFQPGQPLESREATSMEAMANGRAKSVWEIFTNSA